ncbi:hypothetical protein F8M49_18130 [Rhodococcus zopfii]|uniref:Uncharacterized protein n=1 Tax=Rhodococcus zopfii TaxID=43772 RepID=A0ABU3WRX7_9NOCA|nr:hypothetical protein [Rhodococcus zopfii]
MTACPSWRIAREGESLALAAGQFRTAFADPGVQSETVAAHGSVDPEQIPAADPGLAIITPRHGGESVGLTADPEQVVRTDPAAVLLVDMLGADRDSFVLLLSNPAVSELAAVCGDRVLVLDGKQAQALGLQTTAEGAQRIRDWLAGLDRS